MFFDEYLKATIMWPQKRGAVCIYMLNVLANDNGINSWKEINNFSFSKSEIQKIEIAMHKMHDKFGINLELNKDNIEKDWRCTLGATYRSLVFLLKGNDPFNNNSYESLITDKNYELISNKIKDLYIEKNYFWNICKSARSILEHNKDLSPVFKKGFIKNGVTPESHFSNNYTNSPDVTWKILGNLLSSELKKRHPNSNIEWIIWGF